MKYHECAPLLVDGFEGDLSPAAMARCRLPRDACGECQTDPANDESTIRLVRDAFADAPSGPDLAVDRLVERVQTRIVVAC